MYLGTNVKMRDTHTGEECFAMGANDYAKEDIRVVETQMKKDGVTFNSKASRPFSSVTYRPGLDCT